MELWTLLPVGVLIATIATLLGIGGGIVWVPYLILVMDFDAREAIILSFAIQVIGMASGSIKSLVQKKIFWKLGLRLLPLIFLGIIVGAYLSQRIADEALLKMSLGVFSMSIAIFFAFQGENYEFSFNTDRNVKPPAWLSFSGLGVGAVSGFLSTGIGDVMIPLLRSRLKIPMQNAVGTALILNLFLSIVGLAIHLLFSQTSHESLLLPFAYSAVGVAIGGQIGAFFSDKIDESRLKEMFIFLLILIGLHMIYQSL